MVSIEIFLFSLVLLCKTLVLVSIEGGISWGVGFVAVFEMRFVNFGFEIVRKKSVRYHFLMASALAGILNDHLAVDPVRVVG